MAPRDALKRGLPNVVIAAVKPRGHTDMWRGMNGLALQVSKDCGATHIPAIYLCSAAGVYGNRSPASDQRNEA
jgi:hypothetical protein